MKRILLIALITVSSIVYSQSVFYVQKGKMTTKMENADPYEVVDFWLNLKYINHLNSSNNI